MRAASALKEMGTLEYKAESSFGGSLSFFCRISCRRRQKWTFAAGTSFEPESTGFGQAEPDLADADDDDDGDDDDDDNDDDDSGIGRHIAMAFLNWLMQNMHQKCKRSPITFYRGICHCRWQSLLNKVRL